MQKTWNFGTILNDYNSVITSVTLVSSKTPHCLMLQFAKLQCCELNDFHINLNGQFDTAASFK